MFEPKSTLAGIFILPSTPPFIAVPQAGSFFVKIRYPLRSTISEVTAMYIESTEIVFGSAPSCSGLGISIAGPLVLLASARYSSPIEAELAMFNRGGPFSPATSSPNGMVAE